MWPKTTIVDWSAFEGLGLFLWLPSAHFVPELASMAYEELRQIMVLKQQDVDPDFSEKSLISDLANSHLSVYIYKQNNRIWDQNPDEIHVTPLHAEKVSGWGPLWSGDVIGIASLKTITVKL